MKTTHIDGLPGLTLQGKKGPIGIRGNKMFYLTDATKISSSTAKSHITFGGTIEQLLNSSTEVVSDDNVETTEFFLEDEAYNYDYALYSSDNYTYLYILTENTVEDESPSDESDTDEQSDDSSSSDETPSIKELTAWLVDKWTLTSIDVSDIPLTVEVEDLNIKYIPWKGQYFSNRAECIPSGIDASSNIIPGGHEFSILRNDELQTKIQNAVDNFGVCTIPNISGHVYSMEVDDKGKHVPLEGIRIALRTLDDVIRYGGREQYNDIQGEDSSCLTDKKGAFSVVFDSDINSEVPGYCVLLAYDENKMYVSGNFIVTGSTLQSELTDIELYLYDNAETQAKMYGRNYSPKYDIRKDTGGNDDPIFYVADYFSYYDTSRCVDSYEDIDNAKVQKTNNSETSDSESSIDVEENDNEISDKIINKPMEYVLAATANLPLSRFVIYSTLSSEEKSKIRIEAEFYKNTKIKSATMSTCRKDLWDYTKEERDEEYEYFNNNIESPYKPRYMTHDAAEYDKAMPPALDCLSGRYQGLSNKVNFDNEDLRDFKIIIKDYGEGIYVNKYVTYKLLPFDTSGYEMYLYIYYKNAPADISKTLLTR